MTALRMSVLVALVLLAGILLGLWLLGLSTPHDEIGTALVCEQVGDETVCTES